MTTPVPSVKDFSCNSLWGILIMRKHLRQQPPIGCAEILCAVFFNRANG